jgi:hypothetical protein
VKVFLLWHVRHARYPDGSADHFGESGEVLIDEDEGDNVKLLGVYSTEPRARDRIERARTMPGFDIEPDCFIIDDYTVDKDYWAEGFVTIPYDD